MAYTDYCGACVGGNTGQNQGYLDVGCGCGGAAFHLLKEYNVKSVEGIDKITIEDINFVKQLGYRIKLISECFLIDNKIYASTRPKLIPIDWK